MVWTLNRRIDKVCMMILSHRVDLKAFILSANSTCIRYMILWSFLQSKARAVDIEQSYFLDFWVKIFIVPVKVRAHGSFGKVSLTNRSYSMVCSFRSNMRILTASSKLMGKRSHVSSYFRNKHSNVRFSVFGLVLRLLKFLLQLFCQNCHYGLKFLLSIVIVIAFYLFSRVHFNLFVKIRTRTQAIEIWW